MENRAGGGISAKWYYVAYCVSHHFQSEMRDSKGALLYQIQVNMNLTYSLCWLLYVSQQLVSDAKRLMIYQKEQYNVAPKPNQ